MTEFTAIFTIENFDAMSFDANSSKVNAIAVYCSVVYIGRDFGIFVLGVNYLSRKNKITTEKFRHKYNIV